MAGLSLDALGKDSSQVPVLCVGFLPVDLHYEYVFHVSHPCGCSWRVQRRYSRLLALHEELSAKLEDLPPFPAKSALGQLLTTTERDIAVQRAAGLQRYFQLLAMRIDLLRHPAVLRELGAERPEAVKSVHVVRWERSLRAGAGLELEVQANLHEDNCCRPVEGFEVQVVPPSSHSQLKSLEGGANVFTAPLGESVYVPVLPCDAEVEFLVCAYSAVGCSPAIRMQVSAPCPREGHGGREAQPVAPLFMNPGRSTSQDNFGIADGSDGSDGERSPQCFAAADAIVVGGRVQAVWAGDGCWYDAVVRFIEHDCLTVDWLRPRPLEVEYEGMRCVCEVGGDDTTHRRVLKCQVRPTAVICHPAATAADHYAAAAAAAKVATFRHESRTSI